MTETPRDGTPQEGTSDDHVPDVWTSAGESLPGLARVAAYAALHTTEWGVKTSARAWLRVGKAVTRPDEAAALARDASKAMVVVGDLARSVSSGTPVAKALMSAGESLGGLVEANGAEAVNGHVVTSGPPQASLRELGKQLLDRSRDVWNTDEGHPAYERILSELAPDEARILMLLLTGGPQPSVDVRTGGPIGMVSSQLIAPGLTMIGARSGVRYLDQVPAYLNNLFRLGLVWFSREALRDPMHYQVVEAQPDVLEAMHSVKFAKVVRRSIHLTPFGEDFCKTCLVEEETLAVAAFPEHGVPPEVADPRDPAPG
ncbi:Abi-alpha family protein [Nocardioides sp.]|uniref:Abi-alpha family protein n=1 Tax=Nocardioides sp. TaxID=35761 RepID=UPI00286B256C|nr:Abi-alpha family protein [Nocardioides sp.]